MEKSFKKISLSNLAARIVAGEQISLTEVDEPIMRHCPECRKPLVKYSTHHWNDNRASKEVENTGAMIYTDGDAILLEGVRDVSAEMMVGYCPFCQADFAEIEVFCFANVPGVSVTSRPLMVCDSDHLAASEESCRLFLVSIGGDPIGTMSYGRGITFRKSAFAGYPAKDFVSDGCVFDLDCIPTDTALDATPIGVCCGHFGSMYKTENEWAAAEIVVRALYLTGKKHMESMPEKTH